MMMITVIDPKSHFTVLDVDHRYRGIADLQDITDVQIEFVNLHH